MYITHKTLVWAVVAVLTSLTVPCFASEPLQVTPQEPPRDYSVGMSRSKLFISVAKGKTAEVAAMLKAGADVNERGHHGGSLLADAAGSGHLEIVKLLLANGAQVDAHDMYTDERVRVRLPGNHYVVTRQRRRNKRSHKAERYDCLNVRRE